MCRRTVLVFALLALAASAASIGDLHDRGGGLIYDDDLDITLLQNANYAYTSGYDSTGRMTWEQATAWATQLEYQGYDDWRLPQTRPVNGVSFVYDPQSYVGLTDRGWNVSAPGTAYSGSIGSEMAHLFYNSLLNIGKYGTDGSYMPTGWGLQNTGPFVNLQAGYYWSGTEYAPVDEDAWFFNFQLGFQSCMRKLVSDEDNQLYAWAVRDGDSSPYVAPEPEPVPLPGAALLGVLGLGYAGMRLGRQAS